MSHSMWEVPHSVVAAHAAYPETLTWLATLPERANDLGRQWSLRPTGAAMAGHMSVVYPCASPDGPAALKLGRNGMIGPEATAMRAWHTTGVVAEVLASSTPDDALLLQWLDPTRTLTEHSTAEAATLVVAQLLEQLHAVPVPEGVPSLDVELERLEGRLRGRLSAPTPLSHGHLERVLDLLAELRADARAPDGVLLHGDLHYSNVLALPGSEPALWRVIDPIPAQGFPEWEVVAPLRNRWPEAQATGDSDKALTHRLTLMARVLGLEEERARAVCAVVAADNVITFAETDPASPFLPPYLALARSLD